jgi:hypothetical protein
MDSNVQKKLKNFHFNQSKIYKYQIDFDVYGELQRKPKELVLWQKIQFRQWDNVKS